MLNMASWIERAKEIWMMSWLEKAKMWDIESCTKRAKKSWVTFWLEKLAVLATVAGIGFGVSSLRAIEEEREAREEERKIWYWTLLATPAPGNSGKIEALQYLAGRGIPLISIDLSCRTMNGEETVTDSDGEETMVCKRPVYLAELDLSKKPPEEGGNLRKANLSGANLSGANLFLANLSGANLVSANLSGANLVSANLSGADLLLANLSGARLYRANLSDASLFKANLSDAYLMEANLSGADLFSTNLSDAYLSDANLSDANLSDADFKNAIFSSDTTFTNAWAWADEPPRNLPATIQPQLCKYNKGNRRHRRPDPCIPPDTK